MNIENQRWIVARKGTVKPGDLVAWIQDVPSSGFGGRQEPCVTIGYAGQCTGVAEGVEFEVWAILRVTKSRRLASQVKVVTGSMLASSGVMFLPFSDDAMFGLCNLIRTKGSSFGRLWKALLEIWPEEVPAEKPQEKAAEKPSAKKN